MKKAFIFLTALLILVSLLSFSQETKPAQPKPAPAAVVNSGPPPKLEAPEFEYNAGEVIKGAIVEHEFVINNKGEGILKLLKVQPTCGCTITKYDHEIAPGKSGKILASVKTEGFSGDIAKTINVQTNDPARSTFQLIVKARIKTLLSVKPSEKMALGIVYVGTPVEKDFDIIAEDGQPFDITQATSTEEKIRYKITVAPDKKSAKLKVTIPGDYPVGTINANFTLTTTHPKVPTLNISVSGTIREPLSVTPISVVFKGLSTNFILNNPESADLTKVVTVSLDTEPSLEVKDVKSSIDFIQASVENTKPNQAYSIKLHIDPWKVKVGAFEGTLTIVTNKKTLNVPLRGNIF